MAPRKQTETDVPTGSPGGALGTPTTLLLIFLAAVFLFWNMRRRRAFEERFQAQRRAQRLVEAEESAREVANVMRTVAPGAAAAAAAEGLASAARMPSPRADIDIAEVGENGASPAIDTAAELRAVERAEAAGAEERTGVERAQRAVYEAETRGPSDARRMAAAAAAATEIAADATEIAADDAEMLGTRHGEVAAETPAATDAAMPPAGAVAGDGSADCPSDYPIKGNGSSRIYHEPGQSSYANTIPEFCFASSAAAEAAGFRQSRSRGQRAK